MAATGPVTPMIALARAALGEPLTRRARDELLFCLVGVLVGLAVLAVVMALLVPGTAWSVARAGAIVGVLAPRVSRPAGSPCSRRRARLLSTVLASRVTAGE